MSLLELGDPHDADERLDVLGRTVGIRDSLRLLWEKPTVRGLTFAVLFLIPVGVLLLSVAIDPATASASVGERLIVAVLGIGSVLAGTESLDQLACIGTASHDCRHCRSETDRWRAESDA